MIITRYQQDKECYLVICLLNMHQVEISVKSALRYNISIRMAKFTFQDLSLYEDETWYHWTSQQELIDIDDNLKRVDDLSSSDNVSSNVIENKFILTFENGVVVFFATWLWQ